MNRPRLICLLLALITLLAYLPVSQHSFISYDDAVYITHNQTVQAGLTWSGVKWAFNDWHFSNWHPLTWLSHMLDCQLFGLNPGPHHLVNAFLHTANAVLLFLLLFRMTSAMWPAAVVAALFAWHPLHVESVAWAAERKDVLSTFFGLLALLAYACYSEESKLGSRKASKSYFAALLFFALSLLSKSMLVTLPFVFLLLDVWPLDRFKQIGLPRLLLEKSPFFILTVAMCFMTYLAQHDEAVVSISQYPLDLRLGNAVLSYGRYLQKTIYPHNLTVIYPLQTQLVWANVAVAAFTLICISIVVWIRGRTAPYLLVGWLWFLGTLVPVIGLVQVGRAAMADRYSYIPLVGIFIAVVFGIRSLAAKYNLTPTTLSVFASLALAGSLLSMEHQLSYWRDGETLFSHAVAVTGDNSIARVNLGLALEERGKREDALINYREALRINPNSTEALNDAANILAANDNLDEALDLYRRALLLIPTAPLAHLNLGSLLVRLGRFDEAYQLYSDGARLAPDDARPPYLIGKALLKQGHDAEAVSSFRDALRLNAYDLQTLTWLTRVLAADENPQIRNGAESVALAERANALANGKVPFVLDTLAMAYAEAGRFADAVKTIQNAIAISTAARDNEAVAGMRNRLQLYQTNKPYRESFTKSK